MQLVEWKRAEVHQEMKWSTEVAAAIYDRPPPRLCSSNIDNNDDAGNLYEFTLNTGLSYRINFASIDVARIFTSRRYVTCSRLRLSVRPSVRSSQLTSRCSTSG